MTTTALFDIVPEPAPPPEPSAEDDLTTKIRVRGETYRVELVGLPRTTDAGAHLVVLRSRCLSSPMPDAYRSVLFLPDVGALTPHGSWRFTDAPERATFAEAARDTWVGIGDPGGTVRDMLDAFACEQGWQQGGAA